MVDLDVAAVLAILAGRAFFVIGIETSPSPSSGASLCRMTTPRHRRRYCSLYDADEKEDITVDAGNAQKAPDLAPGILRIAYRSLPKAASCPSPLGIRCGLLHATADPSGKSALRLQMLGRWFRLRNRREGRSEALLMSGSPCL